VGRHRFNAARFRVDTRTVAELRRAVALVLAALAVVAALAAAPADAGGTLAWPHFLKVQVQNRRADTRVVIDAGHAGVRWVSQPGVRAGEYLVRVDASGFVRSLDAGLAFFRAGAAPGGELVVRITAPGVDGEDAFRFAPGDQLRYLGAAFAGARGNMVADVAPYVPTFALPMEFEIHVAAQCKANQYLQVSPEWTRRVWRTPDGIAPGTYRVRLNPDFTVSSPDGSAPWYPVTAQPWDWDHPVLGVSIVHSCDPAGPDGVDIVGFGRNPDGTLQHMTTWAQEPDGGYGWQPFNSTSASQPRPEGFWGGNWIVRVPAVPPPPPPLDFSPSRLSAPSLPAVSVAASRAQFGPGQATEGVLARFDAFADALAGIPLALARRAPLLLCSSGGVEAEVVEEFRRVVAPGGVIWLLGGEQALSANVAATLERFGFRTRRLAGATRVETAAAVADAIGPAAVAFVVNGWNYPDALAAGAAAGAVDGGAHVLLTDPDRLPEATARRLAAGGYRARVVFGGPVVVSDAVERAAGAGERIWGPDRDATAAAAAARFFPRPAAVWVAAGTDFVGGIAGGAMAARNGGPLLLVTGGVRDPLRGYLTATRPGAGWVVGSIDEGLVTAVFGHPSH
jgi:putative cell wall-binding protein